MLVFVPVHFKMLIFKLQFLYLKLLIHFPLLVDFVIDLANWHLLCPMRHFGLLRGLLHYIHCQSQRYPLHQNALSSSSRAFGTLMTVVLVRGTFVTQPTVEWYNTDHLPVRRANIFGVGSIVCRGKLLKVTPSPTTQRPSCVLNKHAGWQLSPARVLQR